jgi:phage-related tail fiber protein
MAFKTIHTTFGLAAMAAAEASSIPIALTHMAVGDGNGNPTTPDPAQTELVREMYRDTVNRVYQYPDDPTRFVAELIVPASEGGFTLREIGVFDIDGNLFAVGNLPDTYKPTDAEGAFSDAVIRMEFIVSNADVVTLMVDPNVSVATQTWIINNVTMCSLLPGGTTGQIPRKASNACGDIEWSDPDDVNVVVSTVEEQQTLAALQTNITWATVNNNGLAIYVEGVRLPRAAGVDGWQPHGSNPLISILGQSYPAGTKVTGVQNEPASVMPDPLESSQNLADVASVATSRVNLDVYSKAESDIICPPAAVLHFARNTAPTGWLKANGAAINRVAYSRLFDAIGTTFGAGDGFNTFNLPDLRGEFLRGWDDGRGVDTGRVFGSQQADELKSHTHSIAAQAGISDGPVQNPTLLTGSGLTTGATGGTETRPRNRALLACIRF